MVPDLEDLTYEERLKEIHLTTLKWRKKKEENERVKFKEIRKNCKKNFA